jgi:quinol monooxygenase YgiN
MAARAHVEGDKSMIIVLGSVAARDRDTHAQALHLGREHLARSLQEPGCLRHEVMPDPANPLRLVFVEQWASTEDLLAHFRVPASIAFARALGALAAAQPEIKIYEAREVNLLPRRPTAGSQ